LKDEPLDFLTLTDERRARHLQLITVTNSKDDAFNNAFGIDGRFLSKLA